MSAIFQMAHVVEGAVQPLPNAEGIIETEWAVHELRSTSDFARNNLFLNWYAGGLNFQIEHHLRPRICHVNFPARAPIVKETCREFGVKYNEHPSFRAGVASHFRWLRQMGRESANSEMVSNGV